MSEIPKDLSYAKTHEWIANDGDGTVTVGITEYAQGSLGDLVFVELPEAGTKVSAGDAVAGDVGEAPAPQGGEEGGGGTGVGEVHDR